MNIIVYAKSCRGAMTRYVLQNKINEPEDLLAFEYEGFKLYSTSPEFKLLPKGLTEFLWRLDV